MSEETMKLVDEYIILMGKEQELSAAYKVVKAEREALRDQLSAYMDARGIGSLEGSDGRPVGKVKKELLKLVDAEGFERWCAENGKREDFIRVEARMGSKNNPGLRQWVEDGGELPVGIERRVSLSLRIGRGQKTLLERLEAVNGLG